MEIDDDYSENGESQSEYSDDPDYEIVEDARSEFSKLSVNKKGKFIVCEDSESTDEEEAVEAEVTFPELDEKDQKSLEVVQKLIEDGKVDKLKVDQCKVYLRKNGLRLTGNKETLIQRIKAHLEIINGGGEKRYPASSFILNCKGDACIGDVVMFQQNVYDQFNLVSRSASGPPVGKRIVAGRIIKESYGAAKQQHTFTIEVLWSKGEKPLPPLHPLLIKGRNLYRFNTIRQRWEDEAERQKILMEKHSRGSLARSDREARLREKEQRKALRANRLVGKKEKKLNQAQSSSTIPKKSDTDVAPKPIPFNNISRMPTVLPATQGYPVTQPHLQGRENLLHHAVCKNPGIIPHRFSGGNGISHLNCEGSNVAYSGLNNFYGTGNGGGNLAKYRHPLGNLNQYPKTGMQGQGDGLKKRQLCRHFARGRCNYGDNCKFLHQYRGENTQKRQEISVVYK